MFCSSVKSKQKYVTLLLQSCTKKCSHVRFAISLENYFRSSARLDILYISIKKIDLKDIYVNGHQQHICIFIHNRTSIAILDACYEVHAY